MNITHAPYNYVAFGLIAAIGFGVTVYYWHRKTERLRQIAGLVVGVLMLYAIPSFQRQRIKLEGNVLEERMGVMFFPRVWRIDLTEVQRVNVTAYKEGKKEREMWAFHLASGEQRTFKPSVLWLEHSDEILKALPKHVKVQFSKAEG